MITSRMNIAKQALEKSLEVREEHGYDFRSPLCIYELCEKEDVKVRFVEVSMEGFYVRSAQPTILLSSMRPLPRRAFTCAHELGHHVFGHGSTLDELQEGARGGALSADEFLVQAFAGFLLMPKQGVTRAMTVRGIEATNANPAEIYGLACAFGVGYETIVGHLQYSLRMINESKAAALRRVRLATIRERILGFPPRNRSLLLTVIT